MFTQRCIALFFLFFSPLAAAVPAAEGTCICDSFGCSKVIGGIWTSVSACPAGSQDRFNGPVLAKRNAEHHLVSLINGDLVVFGGQAFNFNEWSEAGDWKKYDQNGPKTDYGWIGPDGKKYDSPEQSWHIMGGRVEPATIQLGAIDSAMRLAVEYDTTTFSGISAGRKSSDVALRARYARDWDEWGLAVEVPIRHQSNSATFGNLDNTSLGVTVMPVYHLMRAGVHGLDADIGGVAGYSRHWYKGGTALAVAGFDNPDYLEIGVMGALRKTTKLATMKFGVSHMLAEDQTGVSMAGRKGLGFSQLQAGIQVPFGYPLAAGADLGYSYVHGLPAGMDASSWKGALSLQYRGRLLNYGGELSRTSGNQDYRTTGFSLWLSRSLK